MNIDNELSTLTIKKNNKINKQILTKLHLNKNDYDSYLNKLNNYRYITDISVLKSGRYLRYIPIIDPNYLPLNQTCIFCDINIDDVGILLVCKTFKGRHFQLNMNENLIFQKLTIQELVLLYAQENSYTN